MNDDYIDLESYSDKEKKNILEKLNQERLNNQNEAKKESQSYNQYEKNKILNKLNEYRLSKRKCEEIKRRRTENKEIYKFGSKQFYKFLQMEREYYIEISDCDTLSSRAQVLPLYYRTFDTLDKKKVLMKIEIYSDKIFISYDAVRVYFKTYALEDEKIK